MKFIVKGFQSYSVINISVNPKKIPSRKHQQDLFDAAWNKTLRFPVLYLVSIRCENPNSHDDVCYKQVSPPLYFAALIQFVRRLYGIAAHPLLDNIS